MFRSGTKVSLSVLILAVLVVGIGAFFAGQFYAGRDRGGDYIVSEPYEEPMGIAIYVYNPLHGGYRREVLVRSMEEVQAAKHLLAERFLTERTVLYGLDPEWRLQAVYVDDDTVFFTPQEVMWILDRRIRGYASHEIEDGSSLDEIAALWDMELFELLRLNDITKDTPPEPGQRLRVVVTVPLINVISVDETTWLVPLYRQVETFFVNTLPYNHSRVVQEGRDGYQEVVTRTTRRGAIIIYEEYTHGDVIVEPVTRIIEVGVGGE